MPPSWNLADVTELDLRLARGGDGDIGPDGNDVPDGQVLIRWLASRRGLDPAPARAARGMVRAERLLRGLFCGLALFSGAGSAAALLRYDGQTPINVAFYLGILVGGQILLLLLLLIGLPLAKLGVGRFDGGWLVRGFQSLRQRFFPRWTQSFSPTLPSCASLWTLRGFASVQTAGVFFNLGILAATLALVAFQDLGFGWATTLDLPPEKIHRGIRTLSWPWGGAWTPDPAEIAASRIRLGPSPAGSADPRAAASWWPFLVCCVAVYGGLPRLGLALGAEALLAWRLRRYVPGDPAAERLRLRLTRAPLSRVAEPGDSPLPGRREESAQADAIQARGPLRLEIPVELDEPALREILRAAAAKRFGVPVADEERPAGDLLLLREVWRPPLEEDLAALRARREEIGPGVDLYVWCVGFPRGQGSSPFEAPAAMDLGMWREHLARLRDPRLWTVPWEEPA